MHYRFNLSTIPICFLLCAYSLGGFTLKAEAQLSPSQTEISEDYFNSGIEKIELGDYEGAITDFREVDIKVNHPKSTNSYYIHGVTELERGNYQDAITYFDQAIEIDPQDIAYYHRGRAKYELGNYIGAIVDSFKGFRR